MKKAYLQLQSAAWTMLYDVQKDGLIYVHDFNKEDEEAYIHPEQLGVIEHLSFSDDHILEKVTIDGVEYTTANPQDLMTYKQPL